ncbi:MAG: pilus assembly protein [Micromonosporaceae bacterium]|nr:pilus assembly protein [Micromonosporaceae bacterium]
MPQIRPRRLCRPRRPRRPCRPCRLRRIRSRLPGRDRGSASIEFAITATAVMALMFTAIQAATWYWARSIALAAAQEGVNAQRAYNAAPGAGVTEATAFIASTGDSLNDSTVTVTSDTQQVQVTVTGRCLAVIPGFCNAVQVTATAHGTVERVTSP